MVLYVRQHKITWNSSAFKENISEKLFRVLWKELPGLVSLLLLLESVQLASSESQKNLVVMDLGQVYLLKVR